MARPRGFEPLTSASGGQRSIQLSYGRMGDVYTLSPERMQPGKIEKSVGIKQEGSVVMVIKPLVVLIAVMLGAWCGWMIARPLGIMTAYLCAVAGASAGLYIGRRIQRQMGDG